MKRLLLTSALLLMAIFAHAQQPVAGPTILSVGDILSNYGLDSAWVNDTSRLREYLDQQPQDYAALTTLCVSIRTKAQKAISSLEGDYPFRDSLIWIDSNTVLADYSVYEYRLRRLAEFMGRQSIQYSRLEQQRIEAEKEAARQRAIEQARREQAERNRMAADLRSSIELHHRAINSACSPTGVTDKVKLKEFKDLYYSYLMVYNKYYIADTNATDQLILRLDELNAFQNDMLENIFGSNSLLYQIENFKNILKARCEKENSDIYRSYSRVFKNTSVPISFADVREYEDYTSRLRTIINVQQRYLQTIQLRASIAAGSDAINQLYGKKYKDVVSSYRDVLKSVNQLPSFTSNAESLLFIQNLDEFVAVQQIYLNDYSLLEDINARSDSISRAGRSSKCYDVVVAYRDISSDLRPVPSYRDQTGVDLFHQQVEDVRLLQQCFLDVIALRETISRLDDTLSANRKVSRTLTNGYKLLCRQVDLKPSFTTVDRGRSFIDMLNSHIEMQELCLHAVDMIKKVDEGERYILSKEHPYRNIGKAYSRVAKNYQGVSEITNLEDLRVFDRQATGLLEVQQSFRKLIMSDLAPDSDSKLKGESSTEKIRLIVGFGN